MPKVAAGRENPPGIEIYYEDHGAGQPVVLTHGVPAQRPRLEQAVPAPLEAAYRRR